MVILKRYYLLISVFITIGCGVTEIIQNNNPSDEPYPFKVNAPDLSQHNSVPNIQVPEVDIETSQISKPPKKASDSKPSLSSQKTSTFKASKMLNMEVCRDDVDVSYKVTNRDGVAGVYQAKVQAQGVIILVSEDREHIKLRSTGWFTQNKNLYQWQPYLKAPPIAKDISIVKGAEFWDEAVNWYLCGSINT